MSFERRRTAVVQSVIERLFESGKTSVRPGDVNAALREQGQPMGTWEVRAEFARLVDEGILQLDAQSGCYVAGAARSDTARRAG